MPHRRHARDDGRRIAPTDRDDRRRRSRRNSRRPSACDMVGQDGGSTSGVQVTYSGWTNSDRHRCASRVRRGSGLRAFTSSATGRSAVCGQCVEWNGYVWHMWKRGYYETNLRLHREVWRSVHGDIPKGFDVHHIDEDKRNNDPSNLGLISRSNHSRHHAPHLRKHQAKAVAGSRAAIKRIAAERRRVIHTCIVCGADYRSAAKHPRGFCSTRCIDRARTVRFEGEQRLCEWCGQRYTATKRVQRFCSKRCNGRATAYRPHEPRTIACATCGRSFTAKRRHERFCRRRCAEQFHRGQKRRSLARTPRRVRHHGGDGP